MRHERWFDCRFALVFFFFRYFTLLPLILMPPAGLPIAAADGHYAFIFWLAANTVLMRSPLSADSY